MATSLHRLTVYVTDDQYAALSNTAEKRRLSMSAVVREMLDRPIATIHMPDSTSAAAVADLARRLQADLDRIAGERQ